MAAHGRQNKITLALTALRVTGLVHGMAGNRSAALSNHRNLNKSTRLAIRNTPPLCYVLCYRAFFISKMTPQEKAKELVKQFYNFVSGWTSTNRPNENPTAEYEGEKMKIGRAKQCALIAVNEIINEIKNDKRIDWLHERKGGEEFAVYWHAVRDSLNAI